MFQINRADNRLTKVEEKTFSELQFREREHLQEWLARMPEALGEELLIIQKEFDGFDDTRERLDLLALDKSGQLVVIENKLDDTGRDVVWQALKYAAYCSTLKRSQIVEIFQQYLNRYEGGGDAAALICEFLEIEELDETVLNPTNSQRIVFVAAHFRKEVTSTALWLLGNGLDIQCHSVKPYSFGDEVLLDVRQVIPTPEAEEYMIGISSKDKEEKLISTAQKTRYSIRQEFWQQLLEQMRDEGVSLYQNISPSKDNWLCAGSGVSSCPYTLIFGKKEARVQVDFNSSDKDYNKTVFDNLNARKDEVEAKFGSPLSWERMDHAKQSRVRIAKPFDGYDRANWPEVNAWLIANLRLMEAATKVPLREAAAEAKASGY